jgi:hypothetical protein
MTRCLPKAARIAVYVLFSTVSIGAAFAIVEKIYAIWDECLLCFSALTAGAVGCG